MLKFKDLLFDNEEIELENQDVDVILHESDGMIIINTDGLAYKTKEIEFK